MGMRTGICGWSGCGKSTLSRQYTSVCHGDDYCDLGWSEASQHLADLFDDPSYDCYEGCALPRSLRKWCAQHREGRPIDHLIVLTRPFRAQTPGQVAQGKGHDTVLAEILPELKRRGIRIEYR